MTNRADESLSQRILSLLRAKGSRVLAVKDIHDRLGDPAVSREDVESAVEGLERSGALVAARGKRYSLLEFTSFRAGKIRVFPEGYGIVYGAEGEADLYIDRRKMTGAMNGDVVLVRLDPRRPKVKMLRQREYLEGEIARVLQREHSTVVGRFHQATPPFLRPFDTRLDEDIEIDPGATMSAREGEMVNVDIERYPGSESLAFGRVIEKLGMLGEPGVDCEVVIRKFHIPHQFPPDVLAAADAIPEEIDPAEVGSRVDLRGRNIVTIDGETAKDFDDAIDVSILPNGHYRLGVHIADVSYYVREGAAIDREAFERATSVYFPGRAVPMLPERLSNGICSLNPRVDRLTFSAEIEIDRSGRFLEKRFYRSVIRTKERMTYTDVNAILTEPTPELAARYAAVIPEIERMHELYEVLRKRRSQRGSIDFDLPQADVILSEGGDIETIRATERNVAHRLIEEFMLAANEVVAQELVFASQPGLFRVHEQPDPQKLEDLKLILKEFKLTLKGDTEDIRPSELQRVMTAAQGTPEERFLTNVVLRSMKRAYYGDESLGHFALALEHYCHFTSPIRRYPDLIVHRRLFELISSGAMYGQRLEEIARAHPLYAQHSSDRERRAEDAEREVLEWKKVIFMREKVGEEYTGIVTGLAPFGLFVELDEIFVQGMVPVATIAGDFWRFHEREHRMRGESTNRELRLGDRVKIAVASIDEDKHQIEFALLELAGAPIARRQRS